MNTLSTIDLICNLNTRIPAFQFMECRDFCRGEHCSSKMEQLAISRYKSNHLPISWDWFLYIAIFYRNPADHG